jgi:hypothetical protein
MIKSEVIFFARQLQLDGQKKTKRGMDGQTDNEHLLLRRYGIHTRLACHARVACQERHARVERALGMSAEFDLRHSEQPSHSLIPSFRMAASSQQKVSRFAREQGKVDLAHHELKTESDKACFATIVETFGDKLKTAFPDEDDYMCALHVIYHVKYCATPYSSNLPSYRFAVFKAVGW